MDEDPQLPLERVGDGITHAMECCDGCCRPSELQTAAVVSQSSGKYRVHWEDFKLIAFHSCAARPSRCYTVVVPARPSLDLSLRTLTRTANRSIFLNHDRINAEALPEDPSPRKDLLDCPTVRADVISATFDVSTDPVLALQDGSHVRSMAKVRAFLSEERDMPHPYTVRDLRHRYVLWKSNGVLHHLSPVDMSSLIRLLGTLSISPPTKPIGSFHTHPRASHMPPSAFVPQWRFLATVFRDKRYYLRYPLLPSDRYWMMRAHLAAFFERVRHSQFTLCSRFCGQII